MTLDSRGSKYGHEAHVCNGRAVIMHAIREEGGVTLGNLETICCELFDEIERGQRYFALLSPLSLSLCTLLS